MNPKLLRALEIIKESAERPLDEYKQQLTTYLCAVTDSTLSYFATLDENAETLTMIAWSASAMMNCSMVNKPMVYKVSETGLWGDAVREKGVVITNDYPSLVKPTKKGYPQGHVHVRKHMNLPIYEGNRMVMVVGVGNKRMDYTNEDAQAVEALMLEAWKALKLKLSPGKTLAAQETGASFINPSARERGEMTREKT